LLASVVLLIAGCDKPEAYPQRPGLPDYQDAGGAEVEVHGFQPSRGMAGDRIDISGAGFHANVELNEVSIGGAQATVVAATETTLAVEIPIYAASGAITVQRASSYRSDTSEDVFDVRAPDGLIFGYNGTAGQPDITSDIPLDIDVGGSSTTLQYPGRGVERGWRRLLGTNGR